MKKSLLKMKQEISEMIGRLMAIEEELEYKDIDIPRAIMYLGQAEALISNVRMGLIVEEYAAEGSSRTKG